MKFTFSKRVNYSSVARNEEIFVVPSETISCQFKNEETGGKPFDAADISVVRWFFMFDYDKNAKGLHAINEFYLLLSAA